MTNPLQLLEDFLKFIFLTDGYAVAVGQLLIGSIVKCLECFFLRSYIITANTIFKQVLFALAIYSLVDVGTYDL